MRNILLLLTVFASLPLEVQGAEGFLRDEDETGNQDGYRPTRIWWNEWSVESSEELHGGRAHTDFPLSYLFDGDAKTTWAHSGTGPNELWQHGGWRSRFALRISTENPVPVDELRIMNGDNRRADLFLRNDRIVEMEIWINDKRTKTVRLSDTMGWHKVALPRQKVKEIGLVFTGIRKGKGPDNDVCVSELALYKVGRKVAMRMPRAVMFDQGNYSGDAPHNYFLIARNGRVITRGRQASVDATWSPDNRYVCGVWAPGDGWGDTGKDLLWVVNTVGQKVVLRRSLPDRDSSESLINLEWRGNSVVEVTVGIDGVDDTPQRPRKHIYRIS